MRKTFVGSLLSASAIALLALTLLPAHAEPTPGLKLLTPLTAGNCVIGGMTANGTKLGGVCVNIVSTGSYATLFLWGSDGTLELFDAQAHGSFSFGGGAAVPSKADALFLGVGGPGGDDKIEFWDWNRTADNGSQIWIPSNAKGAYFIQLYGASQGIPNHGSYVSGISADDDGYKNVDKVNYTPFRWNSVDGYTNLAKGSAFTNCGRSSEYESAHFKSSAFITDDGATVIGTCQSTIYKWTEATGMQPFMPTGVPQGFVLSGISRDGQMLIGHYDKDYQTRINGIWTQSGGWKEFDLTVLDQRSKVTVTNISNDGNIIAGYFQIKGGDYSSTPFILNLTEYGQGLAKIKTDKEEAEKQAEVIKNQQAAEQAKLTAETLASPADQEKYQRILIHGKAAQMYAMALDMRDQRYIALSLKMLDAIIDKYPDSEFAGKAIDLREQLKHATGSPGGATTGDGAGAKGVAFKDLPPDEQKRINAQLMDDIQKKRDQQAALQQQAAREQQQRIQACQSSCQTAHNTCTMDYANHAGQEMGNAIVGILNHNAAAATSAGGQIPGDPNACQNQYDACTAECR